LSQISKLQDHGLCSLDRNQDWMKLTCNITGHGVSKEYQFVIDVGMRMNRLISYTGCP